MDLEKNLLEYSKKFYPFIWSIEGPYLYISNKGFESNKEQGLSYFPSIKKLNITLSDKSKEKVFEDFKLFIDDIMKFYLVDSENRDIKFNIEFEKILKDLRNIYKEVNKNVL